MWQLSASHCLQWHNLYLQERGDGEFARTNGTDRAYRSNRATGCFWRYRSNWSCGSEWTNWSNGRNRRSRTAGNSGNRRDERHSDSYGHDQLYRLWHLPSRLDGSNYDDWPLHHGHDGSEWRCGRHGRLDKLHASRHQCRANSGHAYSGISDLHGHSEHGSGSDFYRERGNGPRRDLHGLICEYQRGHGRHPGRHKRRDRHDWQLCVNSDSRWHGLT